MDTPIFKINMFYIRPLLRTKWQNVFDANILKLNLNENQLIVRGKGEIKSVWSCALSKEMKYSSMATSLWAYKEYHFN